MYFLCNVGGGGGDETFLRAIDGLRPFKVAIAGFTIKFYFESTGNVLCANVLINTLETVTVQKVFEGFIFLRLQKNRRKFQDRKD